MSRAKLDPKQLRAIPSEATLDGKQVTDDPFGGKPGNRAFVQGSFLKIGQQIVGDVVQQDQPFLTIVEHFSE